MVENTTIAGNATNVFTGLSTALSGLVVQVADITEAAGNILVSNSVNITFSLLYVLIGYFSYRFINGQIERYAKNERIKVYVSYTLRRITKWGLASIVILAILAQFGLGVSSLAGFATLFGSTILGFAAINTLGNALAGLIVMTSRPFKIGDTVVFKGRLANVTGIELIYTKMKTMDNVIVSIPNQELLKSEIDNYGNRRKIRRSCTITAGFDEDRKKVRRVLLKAAKRTKSILKEPNPYVRITGFQRFAVEYTLYAFTDQVKDMNQVDAELFENVLDDFRKDKIDLSTPSLVKRV